MQVRAEERRDHSSNTRIFVYFLRHIYSYKDVGGW